MRDSIRKLHLLSWPLLAFVAALRLLYVVDTERYPYIDDLAGDTRPYRERAAEIASGDWIGDEVYFDSPLYPFFLALVRGGLGGSDLSPKIAHALLDTTSAYLIYRITLGFFGAGPALLALLLYGHYGFALFYNGILLKPVLAILLLLLSVFSLQGGRGFLAGLLLGVGVLVRGNFLIIAPFFVYYASRKASGRAALYLAAGVVIPLLLTTARNAYVGRDFVILTYHAGPTFYHGNNPNARGTYAPIVPGRQNPPYEKLDATRIAEEKSGRALKPSEISRYWFAEGFRFIRENRGRFASLVARRALLFWNGREIPDTYDFYLYRNLFPLLSMGVISFGLVAPLAVLGWFLPRRLRGDELLLPGAVLSLFLSLVLLFVFGRYRLPAIPLLIPTAARYLHHLGGEIAGRRYGKVVPLLALTLVALVLTNSGGEPADRATGLFNLGIRMERLGRSAEAEALYREAIEESPRFAGAWNNLGGVLLQGGAPDEARECFQTAVSLDKGHYLANRNLARICRNSGRWDDARRHLLRSLATERTEEILVDLAVVEELAGDDSVAVTLYREALRLAPQSGEAAANLGRLLYDGGSVDEALPLLERASGLLPGVAMPHIYHALVLIGRGRVEEAGRVVEKWLEHDTDSRFLVLRARIAGTQGDTAAAREAYRRAEAAGLPSEAVLDILTGRENVIDWGLRE